MILTPGVVRQGLDKDSHPYRPCIFEAHGRVYFSSEKCRSPYDAIILADNAIDDGTFKYWHSHELSKDA